MLSKEFITEGLSYPIIVVDVQPAYANWGNNLGICEDIVKFVGDRTGKVLMYVNAEQDQLTEDTVYDIQSWWDEVYYDQTEKEIDWNRFDIVDKGYGYLRDWMDNGVSANVIIKTIREMFSQKVGDSRQLFSGDDSDTYEEEMREFLGDEFDDLMLYNPLVVNWLAMDKLKKFSGAYIVGGGKDECLREVELMMNAFNIKYKRISSLVY